jgi:Fe-S cluster biogenesis protein NfuA
MSLSRPIEPNALQERIQQIVDLEILPLLHMDGGRVEVLGIEEGIVRVRMHGSCSGCPGTVQAIVMGVEQELRSRMPEIAFLEAVP